MLFGRVQCMLHRVYLVKRFSAVGLLLEFYSFVENGRKMKSVLSLMYFDIKSFCNNKVDDYTEEIKLYVIKSLSHGLVNKLYD